MRGFLLGMVQKYKHKDTALIILALDDLASSQQHMPHSGYIISSIYGEQDSREIEGSEEGGGNVRRKKGMTLKK